MVRSQLSSKGGKAYKLETAVSSQAQLVQGDLPRN